MIKKSECLFILKDLKEIIKGWDWEEDYYNSGYESRDGRISWTRDRFTKIIEIVDESDLE